jgi:hypothetical protein
MGGKDLTYRAGRAGRLYSCRRPRSAAAQEHAGPRARARRITRRPDGGTSAIQIGQKGERGPVTNGPITGAVG